MTEPKQKGEIDDPQLANALARLAAAIEANPNKHEPEPKPFAKVYQLPLWPEAAPGMPNPVIRAALFPANKSVVSREQKKTANGLKRATDVA